MKEEGYKKKEMKKKDTKIRNERGRIQKKWKGKATENKEENGKDTEYKKERKGYRKNEKYGMLEIERLERKK